MRSHLRSPDDDELVDDHLRAVGEVAELRFPEHQRVGLGERVAVLEAEHRLFRQHRVDDLVARLVSREVIGERVAVLGLLVDQHRVALRERAALAVLARQADRMPSSTSEPNASASPVAQSMPSPVLMAFARASRNRWMVRWTWKSCGTTVSFVADLLQRVDLDAGVRRGADRPGRAQP